MSSRAHTPKATVLAVVAAFVVCASPAVAAAKPDSSGFVPTRGHAVSAIVVDRTATASTSSRRAYQDLMGP